MKNENCIFCKIVSGEVPALKLWEDKEFMAFADIKPKGEGHTLIIPKRHFETLTDVNGIFSKNYMNALQKTANVLMKKYKTDSFNTILNNGEAAGQVVHHIHFHIIPRKKGDNKKWLAIE